MKKILTIDGGGIKGVFAATVISEIENRCNIKMCEIFDMIAGTSTGGIIAAALALGIPAQEIADLYVEKGKDIFPYGIRRILGGYITRSKYKSSPLKDALIEVFEDRRIKECKTNLLIPAFNLETGSTRVFKTPHADDLYVDKDIKIIDCLMSTTAAPTFFLPHRMKQGSFIDGGIGANNPSLIALIEGITRCNWKVDDILLLNIGCLNEKRQFGNKKKMLIIDAAVIKDCFMIAESQYSSNICKLLLKEKYFRLDYSSSNTHINMDEAKDSNIITMKTWGMQVAMENISLFKNTFT